MKIERSLLREGNFSTDLYSLLIQLKDDSHLIFNSEHGLRAPVAICGLGENRFFAAYLNLLSLLDGQKDPTRLQDGEAFNRNKDVVEAFSAYIDDIYSILKCFCPASASKYKGTYVDKWLLSVDETLVMKFKNDIAFTHPFAKINNEIKHNHGRLTNVYLTTSYGKKCFGFFVQKYDAGVIVPFEDVHPKFNGMNTAYSYNWFLYEILGQFYFLSRYATKTLLELIYKQSNAQITPKFTEESSNSIISVLDKLHETVTGILFEDEYAKPFFQVELQQSTLLVKTPADKSFKKQFAPQAGRIKVGISLGGDGATCSFALPYMQNPSLK